MSRLIQILFVCTALYFWTGAAEENHDNDHHDDDHVEKERRITHVHSRRRKYQRSRTRQNLIDSLFETYDERISPNFDKDGPTQVKVSLFILSIDTISETNMDFSMGMFLRQSWHDSRLEYNISSGHERLELDTKMMKRLWIPDLFFPDEKKAMVHQVTVPNKLMHIYPEGKIMYSQRISVTLKCNFDLRKFPLDTQHCAIEAESYGYTIDYMNFEWGEEGIETKAGMQIPQFVLNAIEHSRCDKVYYGVGYTCVRFDIKMTRTIGYYITQVYIPSYLIVFLSWVSFWLDIDAVPARISLGLLTVLTMTTQSAGARNNLPKVSYIKAIDVWMAVCLLFVFLGLVQFAWVNVLSRVEKRRKTNDIAKVAVGSMMKNAAGSIMSTALARKQALNNKNKDVEKNEIPVDNNTEASDTEGDKEKTKFLANIRKKGIQSIMSADREKARNVDRMSRVLFPAVFFLFNVIYWCVYVFWQPVKTI